MNFKIFEAKAEGEERRVKLTQGDFFDLLHAKCKNAHEIVKKAPLFVKDDGPELMKVNPLDKDIRSAFWIDRIVKDLSAWQKYPSRWRCLKAFTMVGPDQDDEGDNVYAVIPFDGSKLGVCADTSFYRSFTRFSKDFGIHRVDNNGLTRWATGICETLVKLDDSIKPLAEPIATYAHFQRALKLIEKAVGEKGKDLKSRLSSKAGIEEEDKKAVDDLLSRRITNVDAYLSEKLDPEDNGFHLARIESYHSIAKNREVWFNSPCLMVKRSKYVELHKEGKIK